MRRDTIQPQSFGWFLVSESRLTPAAPQDPTPESSLDPKLLPPFVGFYQVYLFDPDHPEGQFYRKSINLSDILSIFWADSTDDFLPGFNFYIQTPRKLLLVGCETASEALRLFRGLTLGLQDFRRRQAEGSLFSGGKTLLLNSAASSFDPFQFFESKRTELTVDPSETDPNKIILSLNNLTGCLTDLGVVGADSKSVAAFLGEYHKMLVACLEPKVAGESMEGWLVVREVLKAYRKTLEKTGVSDPYLVAVQASLHSRITATISIRVNSKIDALVAGYFNPKERHTDHTKNFYGLIFGIITSECTEIDPKIRVDLSLIESSLSHAGRRLTEALFTASEVLLVQLIHLLNSACMFNIEFFDFYSKALGDAKRGSDASAAPTTADDVLGHSQIPHIVNRHLRVFFKEIHNLFENKVILFFSEATNFETLDPVLLLNRAFHDQLLRVKKTLIGNLWELVANNTLNTLLRLYFLALLWSFCSPNADIHYEKKLERDRIAITKFFQAFLKAENLAPQIDMFTHFTVLLTETRAERLLQAVLKFNIFFGNLVQPETLAAIFEKNIHVSFEAEKEILGLFSEKSQAKEKSFRDLHSSVNGSGTKGNEAGIVSGVGLSGSSRDAPKIQVSTSGYTKKGNSSPLPSMKRTICNYLPYVSLELFLKTKMWAFQGKSRTLVASQKDRLDLSADSQEVDDEGGHGTIPDNIVKVAVAEREKFEIWRLQQQLQVILQDPKLLEVATEGRGKQPQLPRPTD